MTDTTTPPGTPAPADVCQQLARWLAAADVDGIEIDAPGLQLRMVRGADGYRVDTGDVAAVAALAHCAGIFLDRHPVGADSVARPGARVRAGDLVGLLQIGLVLAPVVTPVAGTVGRALIAPGALAGYGTRLVEIIAGEP